jgi:hypothetical protein
MIVQKSNCKVADCSIIEATLSQLYLGATLLAAFQSSLIKDEEQKMVCGRWIYCSCSII